MTASAAPHPGIASGVPGAPARGGRSAGVAFALVSALSFGISGPFAKSLFLLGWSPAAAILVRIGAGALLLTVAAIATGLAPWREWAKAPGFVIAFGVTGLVGGPLCYFNAIATLPVGTAMLVEYTAPILVFGWLWIRTRVPPSRTTLVGAVTAMVGLVGVVGFSGSGPIRAEGLAWAVAAAACTATYFLLAARGGGSMSPLSLTSGGLLAGMLGLLALIAIGVLPLRAATGSARLGSIELPWWAAAGVLGVVTSAIAFSSGVRAAKRLGARTASFLGLTEVLFAILTAWLLIGEAPTPPQAIGAVVVVTGLVLVTLGERESSGGPRGHAVDAGRG